MAIASGQAINASAVEGHAGADKARIIQLFRVLALEWGPDVRVNGISPGPIADTEGMKRLAPDAASREAHYARIAMKRWGRVEEVAESTVFLCSPAAGYITGTILDSDGGRQVGDASRGDLAKGMA